MQDLRGITVLVTRPQLPGQQLCEVIQQLGGTAIHFPTIEIVPLLQSTTLTQQIAGLGAQDYFVFVSPTAVRISAECIQQAWPVLPANLQWVAIGEGTAKELRRMNLPVNLMPHDTWNSEALLALSTLQQVKDKKITIFQGKDGRRLIDHTLEERGALVTSFLLYERLLPKIDPSRTLQLLQRHEIDMMVATSGVGLKNLKTLLFSAWALVQCLPIVVIGKRLQEIAQNLGYQKVITIKDASHEAIITALRETACQI